MEKVSSWLLSIVGIVIVSLLIDVLLPVGKTSKLIKSVLAIFSIFVFVLPLKNLNLKNFDINSFVGSISIDAGFVEDRNFEKLKALEKVISKNLAENGYSGVEVSLEGEYKEEKAHISKVYVNLCELVLKTENLNIDKYTNIVAVIKKIVSVKEENIIFYEWTRKYRKNI